MKKSRRVRIIIKEMKKHLTSLKALTLAKNAYRQSILASKKTTSEEALWELSHDKTDWKS